MPVTSGQTIAEGKREVSEISPEGLRAIMALEVLNEFSNKYLVIEDNKLVGIKPHLAGDGKVTVGFGDCLLGDDIDFYLEDSRKNRINGYLSDQASEYDKMKDTVIPVDICFERLCLDVEVFCKNAKKRLDEKGIRLTQNQFDAIIVAEYQCYYVGEDALDAIAAGEGREELYDLFLDAHGTNGGFESRTNVEMNIFFDSDYTVPGEKVDVLVKPLEALRKRNIFFDEQAGHGKGE